MIGLACECVNLCTSCCSRTVSSIIAVCFCLPSGSSSAEQRSTLFAYKPVVTCTGTDELPCLRLSSKIVTYNLR